MCRRNRPKAQVVNTAPVAGDDVKSITIAAADLVAYVPSSFASVEDEKSHRDRAIVVQRLANLREIEVSARTLASILDELGNPKIYLFSVDVERFEIDVLRGVAV